VGSESKRYQSIAAWLAVFLLWVSVCPFVITAVLSKWLLIIIIIIIIVVFNPGDLYYLGYKKIMIIINRFV